MGSILLLSIFFMPTKTGPKKSVVKILNSPVVIDVKLPSLFINPMALKFMILISFAKRLIIRSKITLTSYFPL